LNDPAEIVVTITNLGPDSAADVVLEQRGGPVDIHGLIDVVIAPNVGGCMRAVSEMSFACAAPELRPGESFVVTIRGTAALIGQFGISSTARLASYDPNTDDNVVDAVYSVTGVSAQPPPATDSGSGSGGGAQSRGGGGAQSGGGGGAVGALCLALLGLALAGRFVGARRALSNVPPW
jgi:hypothetical protein